MDSLATLGSQSLQEPFLVVPTVEAQGLCLHDRQEYWFIVNAWVFLFIPQENCPLLVIKCIIYIFPPLLLGETFLKPGYFLKEHDWKICQ